MRKAKDTVRVARLTSLPLNASWASYRDKRIELAKKILDTTDPKLLLRVDAALTDPNGYRTAELTGTLDEFLRRFSKAQKAHRASVL